jgi:hypothetical protein
MRLRGRAALCLGMAAALIAGCGGSDPRQDENEEVADYPVEVTVAEFAPRQRLAETTDLELAFENSGDETIPDLALTIYTGDEKADGAFNVRSAQEGLADPNRPVWILENDYPKILERGASAADLDSAPTAGAETSSTNTYTFGELEPGDEVHTVFRVTPVVAGTFTVHYEVAAGLDGNARAVTDTDEPVEGEFVATITDQPKATRVDEQGNVVPAD